MKVLIDIFNMTEISVQTRIEVIVKIGKLINHEYASNITEPIVVELVRILDANAEILKDPYYSRYLK